MTVCDYGSVTDVTMSRVTVSSADMTSAHHGSVTSVQHSMCDCGSVTDVTMSRVTMCD